MRTIDTTATVTPDGTLIVPLPDSIAPGPHRVVIVIDEALSTEGPISGDFEAAADQFADLFAASLTTDTPVLTSDALTRASMYQDHH